MSRIKYSGLEPSDSLVKHRKREQVDILIIERSEILLDLLILYFELENIKVESATSEDEALDKIKLLNPRSLLLDLEIDCSGVNNFLQKLTKLGEVGEIPVYFFLNDTFSETLCLIDSINELGFIAKPLEIKDLYIISQNLGSKRA